jgi:phosphatidylglycerophosphate synthase
VATVRTGPLIGLAVQLTVLAVLSATVGLGVAGWVLGLGCGLVTWAVLRRAVLGPADRVTLFRATLVGGVTALVAESFTRPVPVSVLVPLATAALALDAVDGWLARRTGTVSERGARFDMEVDAFLILVLSVYAVRPLGAWVLAIGVMRYAFAAAGCALPWLRQPLPARCWRKVVAATQGIILVVAAAAVLARPLTIAVVAGSLALLVESFGRDIGWLWHQRLVRGPGLASLPGRVVRRRRHADPALRQRRDAAA